MFQCQPVFFGSLDKIYQIDSVLGKKKAMERDVRRDPLGCLKFLACWVVLPTSPTYYRNNAIIATTDGPRR